MKNKVWDKQHGGSHYQKYVIQPSEFVRWACVNCNSRFTKDTFEEYLEEGRRWYNVKVH